MKLDLAHRGAGYTRKLKLLSRICASRALHYEASAIHSGLAKRGADTPIALCARVSPTQ